MRFSPDPVESRREFFRSSARYGLLALLAGVAAWTARRARLPRQRCVNDGLCGGCAVFGRCGLPPALSVRQAGGPG